MWPDRTCLLATFVAIAWRSWLNGVKAIDLTLDTDVVQNIKGANSTAARISATDYVDLTCKVNNSILDGPGAHLTHGVFLGDTVARETFVTQFVEDVSRAANISASRVLVLEIAPGRVHHDWEANNVIILFRLVDNVITGTAEEDGVVKVMSLLTSQAQKSGSVLYSGRVTNRIDAAWGIVAVTLDVSLRLTTAIEVIGGDDVQEGQYLNQGAQNWCNAGRSAGDVDIYGSTYCQWETWFLDDISGALRLLAPSRLGVLFVKRVAFDAVLVHFRIREPSNYASEITVDQAAAMLLNQLRNTSSALYSGNVTVAADPTWGLSGEGGVPREYSPYLPRQVYDDHLGDAHERCKDVHRCNRGWNHYNSTSRSISYTAQAFRNGLHLAADFYVDFEDWQMGTFGGVMHEALDPRAGDLGGGGGNDVDDRAFAPRGAHFDPRRFTSLGPRVSVELSWVSETRETALLDANRRSRYKAAEAADLIAAQLQAELFSVRDTRNTLNDTQCVAPQACPDENGTFSAYDNHTYEWWADTNGTIAERLRGENAFCPCILTFNTSSLKLSGAIAADGQLATTAGGTEVAVWSFDQVYLGPEITVKVTGQRALALLSRGSLVLNTTISAAPATLGGFPGGGGIGRKSGGEQTLLSAPSVPLTFPLSALANGSLSGLDIPSYNVNGPGSANYRYYLFTITTRADDVDEVQQVCTHIDQGQTLGGCFHLSHSNLSTLCIPHDAEPVRLQHAIETGLNRQSVDAPGPLPYQRSGPDGEAHSWYLGVGRVNVTTDGRVDDEGGRCWNVTFSSAVGQVDLMAVSRYSPSTSSTNPAPSDGNKLSGLGSRVTVETVTVGSAVSGNFSVRFAGEETRVVSSTASASTLTEALLELHAVAFVRTSRTSPVAKCADGLCVAGEAAGGGLQWTVELGTTEGNAEPTSPTTLVETAAAGSDSSQETEGVFDWPDVVSFLNGAGASIVLEPGWAESDDQLSAMFNVSQPFSIALGGVGASHGGTGGLGASSSPVMGIPRGPYSSDTIDDLVGGSGGGRSGLSPGVLNALGVSDERGLQGLGGAGGGAIELVALNDITIGVMGALSVDGGDAIGDWDSGGGGGSGGSVIVAAGGVIRNAGSISARGGNGGHTHRPLSRNGGGGGAGGRVALYGQSVDLVDKRATVDLRGGMCFVTTKSGGMRDDACGDGREGGNGTVYVGGAKGYTMIIDNGDGLGGAGAEGTNSSLSLSRWNGAVRSSSGEPFQAFRPFDGPEYTLEKAGTPGRATFYIKIAETVSSGRNRSAETMSSEHASENAQTFEHAEAAEWGAVFALLGPEENISSTRSYNASLGAQAPSLSNDSDSATLAQNMTEASILAPKATLISVGVIGGVMRHGAGVRAVDKGVGKGSAFSWGAGEPIDARVQRERWYKVDIMMRWDANGTSGEYDVLVDDVVRAETKAFRSMRGIKRVGLYLVGQGRAWFDQIYLGPDFTMGFRCPRSTRRGVELRNVGRLKTWEGLVDPGQSRNKIMQRHENFLSQREKYQIAKGGLVSFDGDGMREHLVDGYVRDASDQPLSEGLRTGSLLEVPRGEGYMGKRLRHEGSARSFDGDGRWSSDAPTDSPTSRGIRYWYGEHEVVADAASWGYRLADEGDWTGGIGACSTDDFVDWRFEGIMLHYANVSDMVLGREPAGGMVLQQPKTLRLERSTRANGTSSSDSTAGGALAGSIWDTHPDGSAANETYVMWMGAGESNGTFGMSAIATSRYPDGPFKLRRTLYPDGNETHDQAVFMDTDGRGYLARTYYAEIEYVLPEAVMQPIWSSVKKGDGSVDFGLSYHRAFYSKDYDDFHDIYLQRWRLEDRPWQVTCVNRITGESRDIAYGEFNDNRGYCNQPEEYKVVHGQGYPVVSSRFKDPEDANNSYWSPESVPSVKAQSWAANYRDGLCGIRKMDEGFEWDDPDLEFRSPEDRGTCSNIADNPIHEALPDKLVGMLAVVETRLAKFVAVSRLTRDLLDTSAIMMSFEGELEDRDDLTALIMNSGESGFLWSAGTAISSTFHPQVFGEFETAVDVRTLYHQYEASENDRARYSLACQLDGKCPVNFLDQLEAGYS